MDPALAADAVNISSQDKLVRGIVGHLMLQLNWIFAKNRNPAIESLVNFLHHSPISNLEKQQRLTNMLEELILKENIIGTTGRTIEDIEKAGYDIVEYKPDDAENHTVRYIISGLIDETGNMVRP